MIELFNSAEITIDQIREATQAFLDERNINLPVSDRAIQSAIKANDGKRRLDELVQIAARKAVFAGACLDPSPRDMQKQMLHGWNLQVQIELDPGQFPFQPYGLEVRFAAWAHDRDAAIKINNGNDDYWLGKMAFITGAKFSTERELVANSYLVTIPGLLPPRLRRLRKNLDHMCWFHLVRPEGGICVADWDLNGDCFEDMPPPNRPQHAPGSTHAGRAYRRFKKWMVLVYNDQVHIFCDTTWFQKVPPEVVETEVIRFLTARNFKVQYQQ